MSYRATDYFLENPRDGTEFFSGSKFQEDLGFARFLLQPLNKNGCITGLGAEEFRERAESLGLVACGALSNLEVESDGDTFTPEIAYDRHFFTERLTKEKNYFSPILVYAVELEVNLLSAQIQKLFNNPEQPPTLTTEERCRQMHLTMAGPLLRGGEEPARFMEYLGVKIDEEYPDEPQAGEPSRTEMRALTRSAFYRTFYDFDLDAEERDHAVRNF